MSKINAQNFLVIRLACESLERSGFNNVQLNQPQGTFPRVYVTAERAGVEYLIGITGREEIQPDGRPREDYTLLRTAEDRKNAQELVQKMGRVPAFVTVALHIKDGTYSPYFRDLGSMGFPRFVPMKPADRSGYQLLTAPTNPDPRIRRLPSAYDNRYGWDNNGRYTYQDFWRGSSQPNPQLPRTDQYQRANPFWSNRY